MEPTSRWLRRHMRPQLAGSLLTSAHAPRTDEDRPQTQRFGAGGARLAFPALRRVLPYRRSSAGTGAGH